MMSDYPQQDSEQPPLCLKRLLGTPPLAAVSLDGELIWYRSPRGGDGIRATLSLPLAPDPSIEAAVAASERSIAAGSLGVSV